MVAKTIMAMKPAVAGPSVDYGFNFRYSAGFVTDGPNTDFMNHGMVYPTLMPVTGINAGHNINNGNHRDRNSGIDARLAGVTYHSNTNANEWIRFDVPPGTYNLEAAWGDAGSNQIINVEAFDGPSGVGSQIYSIPVAATGNNQWFDASGALRFGWTDWVNNQLPEVGLVIPDRGADTCITFSFGTQEAGTGNTAVSHIRIFTP